VDVRWHEAERDDVRLAAADYGGSGPAVLLLHGLCGHAREWDSTAAWLARSHRVVAIEARGHGRSERKPADVAPEAFVLDAAFWIERLELAPAVAIGQSLGGLTALLLAACEPGFLRGLVVAEATPARDSGAVDVVRRWLATWPLPFPSRQEALAFFGGDTLRGRSWCAGLEQRAGGLWPAFDSAVLLETLAQAGARDRWHHWRRIECPALVVRAAAGMAPEEAKRMIELLPRTGLAEIEGAGHDLHLDQPDRWREIVECFLTSLPAEPAALDPGEPGV
jgi:pimeloyl-ACP methyl ester carboxylesterase